MTLNTIELKGNNRNFKVFLQGDNGFLADLAGMPGAIFVVDENAWKYHRDGILEPVTGAPLLVHDTQDRNRSLRTVETLYGRLIENGITENGTLVSIGGENTQNICGFLASTYRGGIRWINVPTTLLAQADSCLDGKLAIDYGEHHNLVGNEYVPAEIHILGGFLSTLPEEEIYNGIGEIAKIHLCGGEINVKTFMDKIAEIAAGNVAVCMEAVWNSLLVKKSFRELSGYVKGSERSLSYGHDLGDILEHTLGPRITHGQAVVLGILIANRIAVKRGILSEIKESIFTERIIKPSLRLTPRELGFSTPVIRMNFLNRIRELKPGKFRLVVTDNHYGMQDLDDLTAEETMEAFDSLTL